MWLAKATRPLGIQGELEYACMQAFNKKNISITGSGRTDAGVHALGQVANFTVDTTIPIDKIPEVLNNRLLKDIAVLRAQDEKSSLDFTLDTQPTKRPIGTRSTRLGLGVPF